MIDYVFIRGRVAFQDLQANQRAVFAASMPSQQLSDHLGLQAVMNLEPATSLAGAAGPPLRERSGLEADAPRATLGGGN